MNDIEQIAATDELTVLVICPTCDGNGDIECDECGGTGEGGKCKNCDGTGEVDDMICTHCDGDGYVECGALECGDFGTGRVECDTCNGQGEVERSKA